MAKEATIVAKEIRKDLKNFFPLVKFSVKSHTYTAGDIVYVEYSDKYLPSTEVEKLINKYQVRSYNPFTDEHEKNSYEGLQVSYLRVNNLV